jgi:hypothetical protein
MHARVRTTLVAAALSFGLFGGVAQARDRVYRGFLTDDSGAQSRFRFTVESCATDSHHDSVCQGRFSRCRTDPCPASKGQAELMVDADGTVFLVLVSAGERLACTLVTQPGPDRGTYACM